MESALKKEFILEGLDCAGCASKIEENVNKITGVSEAHINFVAKTLTLNIDSDAEEGMFSEVERTVKKFEPHVTVKEKVSGKLFKKVLILEGLDCANCALKIEHEVKNLDGVKSSFLDFVSKRLVIEFNSKKYIDTVTEEATKIVKKLEPHVEVIDQSKHRKDTSDNKETHEENHNKQELIRLVIGAVLFGVGSVFKFPFWTEFAVYLAAYVLVGGEVLLKSIKNISNGQVFDENFLMSIATVGAFAIGEFPEGVAVMLFYQVGEFFQDIAVNRSRKSIASLMDIRPDFANLKVGNDIERVSPEEVEIGDIIVVKPGEKIPLDGSVIEGSSMVDTSALTGESVPRDVQVGDNVLSGSINKNGVLTIKVEKEFGESTVSKILDLVQNASSKKAPTENFITKFARYYTPGVVAASAALAVIPPLFIEGATFSQWIYRALVFLVVSCPCALVISIPLSFFGGIGGASRNGILIKGSNYLEALNNVDSVVFDKTGTLTKGIFKVTQINNIGETSQEELLMYAAYAESYSNHPIATSILKAYEKEVNKDEIKNYEEISGHGIKVVINNKEVFVGNARLMNKENILYPEIEAVGTVVHIAVDRKYAGNITISDEIKEDSADAIKGLKNIGVKKTVMLTGDIKSVGEKVAKGLNLDEVYAELLPDQKVEKLEYIEKQKSSNGKLVFVGDGINDAPVLARADIGIAMGGLGSDAAIEAADVVIMTDEPSKIVTAIKIAKKTKSIVWQNIMIALIAKLTVLILGAGGIATMWEAVFADVGVAIIAVLNAMRVMKSDNI